MYCSQVVFKSKQINNFQILSWSLRPMEDTRLSKSGPEHYICPMLPLNLLAWNFPFAIRETPALSGKWGFPLCNFKTVH